MNDTLAAPPSTIRGVHHVSLTVRDIDASVAWYRELFGLAVMMTEDHEGGSAVVLNDPGYTLFVGLHTHAGADRSSFDERRTGLDHIAWTVPDRAALEAWQARFAERGIRHSAVADRRTARSSRSATPTTSSWSSTPHPPAEAVQPAVLTR